MNVKEWTEMQFRALSGQKANLLEAQGNNQILIHKLDGALETLQALYQAITNEDNQSNGVQENEEAHSESASDS
jgi:hypothetical protein